MNLQFSYNRGKDISCLLEYGPGSNNNSNPTKVFEQLIKSEGDNLDRETTSKFIDKYLEEGNYDISEYLEKYQESFDSVGNEFTKIAEKVFDVSVDDDITAYLTINGRCPYNIEKRYFLVTILDKAEYSPNSIAMHELWHFYTWEKYGKEEIEKIGFQKYNAVKESLTVILNLECKGIMNKEDLGYPQHQEYRREITKLWKEGKDIEYIWEHMVNVL